MTKATNELKKKYNELMETVGAAIKKLDPYGLIAGGAPSNEFDSEVAKISTEALKPTSVRDFASFIAEVLNESFGKGFSTDSCLPVAKEIRSELKQKGLLSS
jgi:hypothetical protein